MRLPSPDLPQSLHYAPLTVPRTPELSPPPNVEFGKDEGHAEPFNSYNASKSDQQYVQFLAHEFQLPDTLQDLYKQRGVTTLYGWQHACLSDPDVLDGRKSLIYSAPTGGGKSLVAEILLLRRLCLTNEKNGAVQLLVLPYISIVNEKAQELEEVAEKLPFSVQKYYGSQGQIPVPPGPLLCICTIEKANTIINNLIEEDRLKELGLVVVDEIHLVSADARGAILEAVLTKIICGSERLDMEKPVQIIGMSATLPNHRDLALWLNAKLQVSAKRPAPLYEKVKIEGHQATIGKEALANALAWNPPWQHRPSLSRQEELWFYISQDTSISTLIFCPTRMATQKFAVQLAELIAGARQEEEDDLVVAKRQVVVQELQAILNHDKTLQRVILRAGVAYHNGGLTLGEREVIERGFKTRVITTLCATSTLAAGVNLPARRVIIKGATVGREVMKTGQYRQMVGRAGRPGLDPYGEAYLVVKEKDWGLAKALMVGPMEDCKSALETCKASFIRLCLDFICSKLAHTVGQVERCFEASYLAVHTPREDTIARVQEAVGSLLEAEFLKEVVEPDKKTPTLTPSPLGLATFKTAFSIEEAMEVKDQLVRAQSSLVLSDDLHIVYLTTPVSSLPEPDWPLFYRLFHILPAGQLKVADAIGLTGRFLSYKGMGQIMYRQPTERERKAAVRFWAALLLQDAIHEVPLASLAEKYKMTAGTIQSLMTSASYFAYSMVGFCKAMGWWALELIIGSYISRLESGVKPEIVPLVEVPHVGAKRARALYEAGFKTVESLAQLKPNQLIYSMRSALGPYPMHAATSIIRGAQRLQEKKARELQKSAQRLLNDAEDMVS